jgi:hypothetical protein
MSDRAARRQLATTIRFLARYHESADRKTSAEFVIAMLRDLGQDADADELERLVLRIRSQRAAAP